MLAFGAAAAAASATSMTGCGGSTQQSATDSADASSDGAVAHDAYNPLDSASYGPVYGAPVICPQPVQPSDVPAFKAPVASIGACNDADIAAFQKESTNVNATFTDVYNALTTDTCRKCVFSEEASASWQIVVWNTDMNAGIAFVNEGACSAGAPGGSTACGAAIESQKLCLNRACPSPECDGMNCAASAKTGDCKGYDDGTIFTSCGSARQTLDAECKDVVTMVETLCGSGSTDGGPSDSGAD
jgi:hypothetical protein